MIKFIKTPNKLNDDHTTVSVESDIDGLTVDEMLGLFTDFLRACSYSIDSLEHVRKSEMSKDDGQTYSEEDLLPSAHSDYIWGEDRDYLNDKSPNEATTKTPKKIKRK